MARTVKKVRLTDNTQQGADNLPVVLHPEIESASPTVIGGIKIRFDDTTGNLYLTNNGTDA